MFLTQKHHIALISVDGDPAAEIGQEEAGGQNVYVRKVGETLAQQGWQVDMLTRRNHPDQETIVQHSPNCRTIRLKAGEPKFIGRDELFELLPEFIQSVQEFQRREEITYSLVHTHYWLSSWVGMKLKKQLAIPQVHTYHSLGAVKYLSVDHVPPIANKRLAIEKLCLDTVDCVVATSPQEQEHMRTHVSPDGNIEMIPCGTDIDHFGSVDRTTARQWLGLPQKAKVVLYVGRFDPRKGIETLVRAIAQSKLRGQEDIRLIIGGGSCPGRCDGLERDRIEALVAELGLTEITTFPGRLDPNILPVYYGAADVTVVPSHYEPFGLVPIEAMACRTPVVASAVGGLLFTVVPEVTGLLVPPKDDGAFAEAIDRILSNPALRDELGQAGRQRMEIAFSWESVAARLGTLYSRLIAQSSTVPAPAVSPAIASSKPQVAA